MQSQALQRNVRSASLAAALLIAAATLSAQQPVQQPATLTGQVTDPTGAFVSGADVTLKQSAKQSGTDKLNQTLTDLPVLRSSASHPESTNSSSNIPVSTTRSKWSNFRPEKQ